MEAGDGVPLSELVADAAIGTELRDVLESVAEAGAAEGDAPGTGSFEPFIGVDPDDVVSRGSGLLVAPDAGGIVRGRLVIANPANHTFAAVLVCLVEFVQVDCDKSQPVQRLTLTPATGRVYNYAFPVRADSAPEITFLLLIEHDRYDPLPASRSLTIVAANSWADWASKPVATDGTAAAPSPGCSDSTVSFESDPPPTNRGFVERTANVSLFYNPCSTVRAFPLLVANHDTVVTTTTWPAHGVALSGLTAWPIPKSVPQGLDVTSIQGIVVVFAPDVSGPGWRPRGLAAEELLLQ